MDPNTQTVLRFCLKAMPYILGGGFVLLAVAMAIGVKRYR